MSLVNQSFSLTNHHKKQINSTLKRIKGASWSFELPVFLLDRCWLKLEEISIGELPVKLPVNNSEEAPELVFYKQLKEQLGNELLALQESWREFGMDEFHRALRNAWEWEDHGNIGWKYKNYIHLISKYKENIEEAKNSIPLLILGRKDSKEPHQLNWIHAKGILSRALIRNL